MRQGPCVKCILFMSDKEKNKKVRIQVKMLNKKTAFKCLDGPVIQTNLFLQNINYYYLLNIIFVFVLFQVSSSLLMDHIIFFTINKITQP